MIFRYETEQCGLPGVWDVDPEVHRPALRVPASGAQEDYSVWTKWNRKNLPSSETGWAPGSKVN